MKMSKITIAVNDMETMVAFYNSVFHCDLNPIPETPFYAGTLFGTQLLFCPNFIAEVKAEKNRIQFDVVVDNLDALVETVKQAGGSTYDDRSDTEHTLAWGIKDPDGNSFALIQPKA